MSESSLPPDYNLGQWHGLMTGRMNAVDESIKRLESSIDKAGTTLEKIVEHMNASLEGVRKDIAIRDDRYARQNTRLAYWAGAGAALLILLQFFAPTINKRVFGDMPPASVKESIKESVKETVAPPVDPQSNKR